MCGILFSSHEGVSKEKFMGALALMKHRGPDVPDGYYSVDQNQFGHCRLKILDLDNRSNQPFFSTDKRYILIFNGEIYNFQDLAIKYDLNTTTTSDTEVLMQLLVTRGKDILCELDGMFAFVFFDTRTRQILAARDSLGVKPLYFYQGSKGVVFSSEIASLLSLTDSSQIDDIGLRQYKKLRTFFNGRTLYKNVSLFPAGSYYDGQSVKQYWQYKVIEHQMPPSDEELRHMIQSSVEHRCLSDVPVGSYLSGGLDSTIVAGLSHKPDTWTVGFEDSNEFEYARIAARCFASAHHEVLVTREQFLERAQFMIKKRREPLSVPNEVLLYLMTSQVKSKNTVILSGEGADELFFGYDRIFRWAAHAQWDVAEFEKLYAYGTHSDTEIIEDAVAPFLKYGSTINIVAAFFQIAHLHGLLRRLDNSTMLCSVEARVPFVDDIRLIERMNGVPFSYRMQDGIVKAPLKRIFSDVLPAEIINRKKVGFPVPLDSIDFGVTGDTGMDRWLNFNLLQLGIEETD